MIMMKHVVLKLLHKTILRGFTNMYCYFTVCVSFLTKLSDTLSSEEKSNPKDIERKFKDLCRNSKGKNLNASSLPFMYDVSAPQIFI